MYNREYDTAHILLMQAFAAVLKQTRKSNVGVKGRITGTPKDKAQQVFSMLAKLVAINPNTNLKDLIEPPKPAPYRESRSSFPRIKRKENK